MIGLFGSGGTTGDVTNNFYGLSQYSSIAALKSAPAPADGTKVVVGGIAANGDGGGGVFYYDEASSATGDDVTIIEPTAGVGRWFRAFTGLPLSGATADRPSWHAVGLPYYDTTLGKPIWWSGTEWVDAAGDPADVA